MSNTPLHVVILAAGKGSRMRSKLPKVLHRVAGKPLLRHVIDCALELKPAMIHVVVGHGKDRVIENFQDHPQTKTLEFVVQEEQLGTGHAVSQALPSIPEQANVLMLTADVPLIKSGTLKRMTESMRSHTLTVLTAIVENPFGLGRITRDESDFVSGIVEEKDADESQRSIREINSGIICARRKELASWLEQVGNTNKQKEYYLTDVVGLAYKAGDPITTLQPEANHEVDGINSRTQLAAVERAFQRQQAQRLMESGVTIIDPARIDIRGEVSIGEDTIIDVNVVIQGPTRIGSDCTIGANSVITESNIDDGVTVHSHSVIEKTSIASETQVGPFARLRPGTVLARGVKIGNFVETKNAELAPGAKVNHLSYVGDATVGSNTNIGAGVITCNYDGANKHRTTIGKDVFVGSDCQLIAPVTIADGATIGAGSTISSSVSEGVLAISRSKQREINGWQRPVKDKK